MYETTARLTEELLKRDGVNSFKVEPYEEVKIIAGGVTRTVTGPAIILINQD